MEKVKVYTLSFITAMLTLMGMLCGCTVDNPSGMYTLNANVVDLESNNVVVVEDCNGEAWAYIADGESYIIGQSVTMTMDDCGTENITDDVILAMC